ncbi:MAG: MAPEG family protein [Rhodospirillales bacterium]
MTPDLTLLVCAVVLTAVQAIVAGMGANGQAGLTTMAGNREHLPEILGWPGRAARAHRNMLENLPLFAALVLIAHVAGRSDATSILGEHIFVWSRLVYAGVYIVGVPWLRSAVFAVSVSGMGMVLLRLV